jgi:hypothetical protein
MSANRKYRETMEARSATVRANEDARKGVLIDEVFQEMVDVEFVPYEIRLERPADLEGFRAVCSCERWSWESTKLKEIGTEAKKHVEKTGHQLRGA